ncbi:UPF0746 protein DDB_G0281095-like isoform X3 [Ruditapes philippinarum]|uniref:UPF0746 protein DDB_G0281095-like isoform X3 n=1 Tax=Ruditapes philippinarum TaxID=129788 RepID=UPI00295B0324|nr:UPF0746 protein DDB_G0281095-like isoform X3 [Ruditapes philippinarum]
MAANGRGNMRPAGRSPPFLAIGLFVALVILGFNYWSLSSRNGEQANEIVLLESELRLVNAKKTSAEKRSEAISDKVSELETQMNSQKEIIAKAEADRANLEKEKQASIERNMELENEVRGVRDQQLPACETDKKNLQQEVEQLRADIEVHKNRECGRSDCDRFINKERDGLIEDMYKVVGALPLISMYKANINLGSYQDQISRLASQMDQDALKKQDQQQQQQQQQQQALDPQQQQQQPVDTQQQQSLDQQQPQQPSDTQQQQQQQNPSVDGQQQQAPVDTLQQQQHGQVDTMQQQQQGLDDTMQQQHQQGPVDTMQQQAPSDNQQQTPVDVQQQQEAPVDQQQQQPYDQQAQAADTNVQTDDLNQQPGVGPAPIMNQDPSVDETKKDASNVNDPDNVKALDADRLQNAEQGEANTTTADAAGTKTTTKGTLGTTTKPGIKNDNSQIPLNVAVDPGQSTDTNIPVQPHIGDDKTPAGDGILGNDGKEDGDYDDDEDANADRNAADDDDTLRVNKDGQEYNYDDGDDDDNDGDYDYDKHN